MVHKSLRSLQLDVISYPTQFLRYKKIFTGQIIIITFFFEDRHCCVALGDLELVM